MAAPTRHRRYPDGVVSLIPVLRRLALVASVGVLVITTAGSTLAQELSPAPSSAPSVAPLEARPDGNWDVVAFDAWSEGLAEPHPDTILSADFLSEGRLEGETGCGTYFGGYSVDGEGIRLGIISKGPDPCSVKHNEEAVAFSVALDAVVGWRPTITGLELIDESGVVRVVLRRGDDAGLTGAWAAERYTRSNGKSAEPLPDSSIALTFDADGNVTGSTGCRWFEGRYSSEADRVIIAPIETVGLPCEGDLRRQERRVLRIFDEVVLWHRQAEGLFLTDAFDEPLLELRALPEPAE